MGAEMLTDEQFSLVAKWACKIAREKGFEAPNGLSVYQDSTYDPDEDRYEVRVWDQHGEDGDVLTHGVTLVFTGEHLNSLEEGSKPLYWREIEDVASAAARVGENILKAIKALRRGIRAEKPTTSKYLDSLWAVRCRKGRSHFVTVTIAGCETCQHSGRPSGKVRVSVKGRWDVAPRHFRQRKDGSFNVEAIATEVDELIDDWVQTDEDQALRAKQYGECQDAIRAAGVKHDAETHWISPRGDGTVEVNLSVKVGEIDALFESLIALGLVRKKRSTDDLMGSDDE